MGNFFKSQTNRPAEERQLAVVAVADRGTETLIERYRKLQYEGEQKVQCLLSKREEELQKRAEELANAESNVLPHQRSLVRKMKPGHFKGSSGNDLPDHYNIGFFGMVNAGKSSLLNSIFYAVKGEYPAAKFVPVAPSDYKGLHTKRTYGIHITDHLCLVDTPGIIPEHMREREQAVLKEIKSRLERSSFTGSKDDTSKMKDTGIHCAVVVINPEEFLDTRDLHTKLIRELEERLGSFPIAVITHVDISTAEKIRSTRGFLHSKGVSDIYEVGNLHEHSFEKKYQIALLNFLERSMFLSDSKTKVDPVDEDYYL